LRVVSMFFDMMRVCIQHSRPVPTVCCVPSARCAVEQRCCVID
jgi:hypothetical protein